MYCTGDLSPYSLFRLKNTVWDIASTLQIDHRGSATTKGAAA